jgi:succinate dehydrogenase hydrophobic anchor subunit
MLRGEIIASAGNRTPAVQPVAHRLKQAVTAVTVVLFKVYHRIMYADSDNYHSQTRTDPYEFFCTWYAFTLRRVAWDFYLGRSLHLQGR